VQVAAGGNTSIALASFQTGACCMSLGCFSGTDAYRTAAGGTWLGIGEACSNCPASCAGDITGDGQVGIHDLLIMLEHWGPCP
jgi:hypothetical protein